MTSNLKKIGVIFRPQNSRRIDSKLPALNCAARFPIIGSAGSKSPAKGATGQPMNSDLEIKAKTALIEGTNLLTPEEVENLRRNPFFQMFEKHNLIEVVEPKVAETASTGTTSDFDPPTARQLIADSLDLEWLKQCIVNEVSRPEIAEALRERIKQVEKSEAASRAAAAIAQSQTE
ncbi:MAG TPA: hypothetical protein V6C65_27735 [Allocoleopsis sp.]